MPEGYAGHVGAPADELTRTDAERACLDEVRRLAGTTGGPLENHNVRVFLIAERLADGRGLKVDREVLLCAAHIHDAGLYPGAATDASYVEDGGRLAQRLLAPYGWPPARLKRCKDAIERHHELRPQWKRGVEVELTAPGGPGGRVGWAGQPSAPAAAGCGHWAGGRPAAGSTARSRSC